jgi:glycine cleavage system transcriptional repressor
MDNRRPDMNTLLVISALGEDRPGIVNDLSATVLEYGCNIADSRMSVLGGEFALILLVSGKWDAIAKLEQTLPSLGTRLGLLISCKRTTPRKSDKPLIPYEIEVVSVDHPGIVHDIADFVATRDINIETLETESYAAAHTGTPMFSLNMRISIPGDTHIATLRDEFTEFCDDLNLDAVMEPARD